MKLSIILKNHGINTPKMVSVFLDGERVQTAGVHVWTFLSFIHCLKIFISKQIK